MACELTTGFSASACKNGVGGIKRAWFGNYADFVSGIAYDGVTGEVQTLPEATIFQYDFARGTGQFDDNPTPAADFSGVFFDQKLSIQLAGLSTAKRNEILKLAQNRLVAFVQDAKNNIWMMGISEGCDVSGGGMTTGKAKADFSGVKLEFTAQEPAPAVRLEDYATTPFDNFVDITIGTQSSL